MGDSRAGAFADGDLRYQILQFTKTSGYNTICILDKIEDRLKESAPSNFNHRIWTLNKRTKIDEKLL